MRGTTLKRIAVCVCSIGVVALAAANPAQAGFKKGRYLGATSEGQEIAFTAGKQRVRRLAYAVAAACEDQGMALRGEISGTAPIGARGRFYLRVEGTDPQWGHFLAVAIRGKLKRKRARGRILATGHRVDGTPCSSVVTWTATWRGG